MTKDEALKLALEALISCELSNYGRDWVWPVTAHEQAMKGVKEAITTIKEALAQPEQEPVDCYGYAARLATSIWKQHYQKTAPQWQVLDDLIGVLTQIDNMAAGLISTPLPVQPEQEPVAWEQFHEHLVERNFCPRCGKRTADPTMIHTCTPPVAAGSQAFYGFPHGPVSTPNAGGKCVTAGETAPKEST